MNVKSKFFGNFIPKKDAIYKCEVFPIPAPGDKIGTIICNGDYEINALFIMDEIQKGEENASTSDGNSGNGNPG